MSDGISSAGPPIPPGRLPLGARSPGKCILFGEHAVVRGEPEVLFAIDLYTQIVARPAEAHRLNGSPDPVARHPYLARALAELWPDGSPLDLTVTSRLPKSAGLGSSAAFVAALSTILASVRGGLDRAELARVAYRIEQGAQGVGSPGDTTAVVAGGLLGVNAGKGEPIWAVADDGHRWEVRRLPDPGWTWVIGSSGVPRATGPAVAGVGRLFDAPGGPGRLEAFAEVARSGLDALLGEDREGVGGQMRRNQALLRAVGVSHPRLEAMIDAVAPACWGEKLTGAGAGGSIVALPRAGREMEAVRRLTRLGVPAWAVRVTAGGADTLGAGGPGPPVSGA